MCPERGRGGVAQANAHGVSSTNVSPWRDSDREVVVGPTRTTGGGSEPPPVDWATPRSVLISSWQAWRERPGIADEAVTPRVQEPADGGPLAAENVAYRSLRTRTSSASATKRCPPRGRVAGRSTDR